MMGSSWLRSKLRRLELNTMEGNVRSDRNSIAKLIKFCGQRKDISMIRRICADKKWITQDIVVSSSLIRAYANCGSVKEAQDVFNKLAKPNVVSYTALIAVLADQGFGEEAVRCFRDMQRNKVIPNSVTYISALKACAVVGAIEIVNEIHGRVKEEGLMNKDTSLGNALIHAYAKCGVVKKTQEVFDQLVKPNVVSWTVLIAGYADEGLGEKALKCFVEMKKNRVIPNSVTYISILKACAIIGAVDVVKEIHLQVGKQQLLNEDIVVGSMLVDAYAKCGAVKEAHQIFYQLGEPNVVSWTALIAGYAKLGCVYEMLELFNKMVLRGILADPVMYIVLLNGCSHGALLDEGQRLFSMMGAHGLARTPEHYTCMVDMFCRAGLFDKAKCFVIDHKSTLLAFMGACREWVKVDHGRWALEKLLQFDQKCISAYVCMSNIYAAAGMMKKADEVEHLRVKEIT